MKKCMILVSLSKNSAQTRIQMVLIKKLLVMSLVGYKFSLTFAATERPEPGQISLCIFIDDITLPRGYM